MCACMVLSMRNGMFSSEKWLLWQSSNQYEFAYITYEFITCVYALALQLGMEHK